MKRIALASAAMIALAGVASAAPVTDLTSASKVTLDTLAPTLQAQDLTSIQVREINAAVNSDEGLSNRDLTTILTN